MTTGTGEGGTGEEPVGAPGPVPGPVPGSGHVPGPGPGPVAGPVDGSPTVSVAEGVATLSRTLDGLLAAEVWTCTDAGVRDAVVELERQAARLEAVRLRVLAAADERSVAVATGAPSTADWLVATTTTRAEHARRRVELAVALQGPLAATGTALAAGEVTGDQAGVIHTTMGRLHPDLDADTRADAQAFLLQQATHLDPRRLARVGRHLTARLDPGADDDLAATEARAERQRQVRCTQADDGAWLLSGVLDPVGGATLMAALEPLAAPRPAADGTPDTRSHPHRLAEALLTLADAHLAGHTGTGGSRPRLVVTVPAATLADPAAPGAAPGSLPGGHPVSGQTTSLLACDAEVVPVLVDDHGSPLDVSRTMYAFPDKVRTAIRHRDQTCSSVRTALAGLHPPRRLVPHPPPRPVLPRRGHQRTQRDRPVRPPPPLHPPPRLARRAPRHPGHLAPPGQHRPPRPPTTLGPRPRPPRRPLAHPHARTPSTRLNHVTG